jgi:hypothetical protein
MSQLGNSQRFALLSMQDWTNEAVQRVVDFTMVLWPPLTSDCQTQQRRSLGRAVGWVLKQPPDLP